MDRLNIIWLYDSVSRGKLFSLQDISRDKKRLQQVKNLLSKMVKQKRIKRIWKGLYHIVPFEDPTWKPSQWEIAEYLCKKKEGHVFFFTALEIHGLYRQHSRMEFQKLIPSKQVYLRAKKKGTGIERKTFDGVTYIIYRYDKKQLGLTETSLDEQGAGQGRNVKIPTTDIEETFIECIQRIEETLGYVKTIAELLTLFQKAGMSIPNTLDHLDKHKSLMLSSKVGLLLELLDEKREYAKQLDRLSKNISKKAYYFRKPHKRYIGLAKEHFKHIHKWNLMVPNSLFSIYELQQGRIQRLEENELAKAVSSPETEALPQEIIYTTKIGEPELEKTDKEKKDQAAQEKK